MDLIYLEKGNELLNNNGSSLTGFLTHVNGAVVESYAGYIRLYNTSSQGGGNLYTDAVYDSSADNHLIEFDWKCLAATGWYDDDNTDSGNYIYLLPETPTFDTSSWGYLRPNSPAIRALGLRSTKSNMISLFGVSIPFVYADNRTYAVKLFVENTTGKLKLWIDGVYIGEAPFTPLPACRVCWHWHSYIRTGTSNSQIYDNIIITTAWEVPPVIVSGVITDAAGLPVERVIRIYNRSTGELYASTISDGETGAYSIMVPPVLEEVQRIVLDNASEAPLFNDLIDRILVV